MDVRKSTRLRKKPTVTYHPQRRNKRLKRSSPNEEKEEEEAVIEEEENHQTQRKPRSVDKKAILSVSSRHHKIFHDLFGMMRYTKPYNQFLAYIQQNHVTNDDLQQILKLHDKKHGYNLIHQALSCYNISTNHNIDYNLVKLFLLQVRNNKNKISSPSPSAEEASSSAATAAAATAAAAAKEALLVPTKDQKLTPLHIACCNIQKLVPRKLKILLDLDTTKSSIYRQSKNGVIPLHCLCSGIDVDGLKETIQLLLQYDKTKKSLLIKNKLGQTPIDKVANEIGDVIIITNHKKKNDTKLSWLFPLLVEERIKVVKGPELWRNRLRMMLSQLLPPSSSLSQQKSSPSRTQQHRSSTNGNNNNNDEDDDDSESETEDEDDDNDSSSDDDDDYEDDDESILEGIKTRLELKQQFQELVKEFQYRANEYDQIYEGMLWLELAIWKGSFSGLQSLSFSKEERKKRWLTCGSTTIVKLVSQYF